MNFADSEIQDVIQHCSWWSPKYTRYIKIDNKGFLAKLNSNQDFAIHTYNEDLYIVSDCRIDNCEDLRRKFNFLGRDDSVENIILKLYHHIGPDCATYLKGAFAFVIFDKKNETVFAARDPIGINALYYYHHKGTFLFGNQKKGILHFERADTSPDWDYIVNKLYQLEIGKTSCEYAHLNLLQPGHNLELKNNQLIVRKYYEFDIHKTTRYKNKSEYTEHFLELFRQAIDRRIRDKSQNVGAHLSGGLDSAGICGVAQSLLTQQYNSELSTFSYTFPEGLGPTVRGFSNENHLINDQIAYSKIQKANNISTPINRLFMARVRQEAEVFDGFSRTYNLDVEFEILKCAQNENVNVMLSGFVGDEVATSFARTFYLEYLAEGDYKSYISAICKNPKLLSKSLPSLISTVLPGSLSTKANTYFTNQYDKNALKVQSVSKSKGKHNFASDFIASTPILQSALENGNFYPLVHNRLPLSFKEYQVNYILRNQTSRRIESEKLSGMKFGIEYRYPMADIDLVEYVLSLPVDQKIDQEMNRKIYRKSMANIISDSIRLRDDKSGSLKPMISNRPFFLDKSMSKYWTDAKQENLVDFMNVPKIDTLFSQNKMPGRFFKYMVLVELLRHKKIRF